tara:strand:- start:266 stop:439 length:174 start_codon:yes stop_codon:yes gene_type:complete
MTPFPSRLKNKNGLKKNQALLLFFHKQFFGLKLNENGRWGRILFAQTKRNWMLVLWR